MKRVAVFSVLLLLGLLGSQWLPVILDAQYASVRHGLLSLTMAALAFIMIHVGYEFDIDRANPRQYVRDYGVAFAGALLPWMFLALYFMYVMLPPESWTSLGAWKETLLVSRFASPTATGVLFSMLAAAGLTATWVYKKARVLVIFDDLDTVLLLIPLQALLIGWAWQLGVAAVLMIGLLFVGYIWLHRVALPSSWPWIATYALVITALCELIRWGSAILDPRAPVRIEVLIPAFVLGSLIKRPPAGSSPSTAAYAEQQQSNESISEERAGTLVAGAFMLLVGLSMPRLFQNIGSGDLVASTLVHPTRTISQPALRWNDLAFHVLVVTGLANLGKMAPALCYHRQATWRERLALSIAMWPRGEMGAGILVMSVSYGIGGPVLTVAMLSLALNMLLTGPFILLVRRLCRPRSAATSRGRALNPV